jgi:hypothetical protein
MGHALRTAIESHAVKNPHLLENQEDAPVQLNTDSRSLSPSTRMNDDSVEQKEWDRRRVPKPRQVKEKKKPALSSNVLAAMGRIPSSPKSPRRVGGRRHPSTPASKAPPSPRGHEVSQHLSFSSASTCVVPLMADRVALPVPGLAQHRATHFDSAS